jgi:hypothetical protein
MPRGRASAHTKLLALRSPLAMENSLTKTKWDQAVKEIDRLERFIEELNELTHKHRIAVKGCRIQMYPATYDFDDSYKYLLHPTLQVPDPDVGLQITGDQSMIEWVEEHEEDE